MRHLGILLVVLAGVLGCAVPVATAQAAPAARIGTQGVTQAPAEPAPQGQSLPEVLHPAARIGTGADCMSTQGGWAQRPTACIPASQWKVTCRGQICVHSVKSGTSASKPAWVADTVSALDHIYATYRGAGYRMPIPDDDADGAPKAHADAIDIYLVDFATFDDGAYAGYYGYCAPAQPARSEATSAFCVFDNDYANRGYTTGSEKPVDVLHVTAAHEFFHAVQFSYNAHGDPWVMEATATWAEDELYSGVNDNRQYLPYGPLGKPGFPMDDYWYEQHGTTLRDGRSDPRDFTPYGDWIFFRYLTEHVKQKAPGGLPVLVRQVWQGMDGVGHTPKSSIRAVAAALRKDHTSLVKQWGAFTAANRSPRTYYSEGRAYPVAKPTHATTVSRSHQRRSGSVTLQHLTAATERIAGRKVPKGWHLHLVVTVPRQRASVTTAWLTVWKASGHVTDRAITLRRGVGRASLGFAASQAKRVDLTLGNAQTTYRCGTGQMYSCDGTPTGDGLTVSWKAALKR